MLKNMVALVTGGSGSLGLATVRKLIENECKVMTLDLREVQEDETETTDGGLKGKYLFQKGDITSEKDVGDCYERIKREYGKLDAIVNCAGVCRARATYSFSPRQDAYARDLETSVDVNLKGTFNVIRLGVPLLVENQPDPEDGLRGVIVNTSGFAAFHGQMGQVPLAAAWGGIESMTLPLCRDLAQVGIRVMTVSPGLMDSNLISGMPKKVVKHLAMATPSPKRMGRPDEYADIVLTIIRNRFLNGEIIRLDGGLRLNFFY